VLAPRCIRRWVPVYAEPQILQTAVRCQRGLLPVFGGNTNNDCGAGVAISPVRLASPAGAASKTSRKMNGCREGVLATPGSGRIPAWTRLPTGTGRRVQDPFLLRSTARCSHVRNCGKTSGVCRPFRQACRFEPGCGHEEYLEVTRCGNALEKPARIRRVPLTGRWRQRLTAVAHIRMNHQRSGLRPQTPVLIQS